MAMPVPSVRRASAVPASLPSALVLSVGTNPLACAVTFEAHRQMTPHLQKVHLVGSDNVGTVMGAVASFIGTRAPDVDVVRSSIEDPWSAGDTFAAFSKAISDARLPGVAVWANYTAGTKQMSVQLYAAAIDQEIALDHLTYLDPHDFCLRRGPFGRYPAKPGDLRSTVKVDIEEMLTLHGLSLDKDQISATPKYLHSAKVLGRLSRAGRDAVRGWCGRVKKAIPGTYWELPIASFTAVDWPNVEGLPEAIGRDLELDGLTLTPDRNFDPVALRRNGLPVPKKVVDGIVRHLEGSWLEAIVHAQIDAEIARDPRANEFTVWSNVKAKPPADFEVDVAVLHGYRLTAISCTLASLLEAEDHNRPTVKLKTMEVMHRAQQLGGEEGRAVVVSRANDADAEAVLKGLPLTSGIAEHLRLISLEKLNQDIGLVLANWKLRAAASR